MTVTSLFTIYVFPYLTILYFIQIAFNYLVCSTFPPFLEIESWGKWAIFRLKVKT